MIIRRAHPIAGSRADLLQRLAAAKRTLAEEPPRRGVTRQLKRKLAPIKAGRPSLMSLAFPPPPYRVDQALCNGMPFFETAAKSADEDLLRIGGLLKAALSKADRRRARRLAARLLAAIEDDEPHPSLASSRFARELRLRVIGAIWQLHDQLPHLPRAVFTIIPRGLSLTEEELNSFDIKREIEALRGALKRAGSSQASGCFILFLHAEWDGNTGRYQLHFHGWAAGDMINVVRRLRKQRRYDSSEEARIGDTDGVHNRVVVSRKPLASPAYRISYRFQAFWTARRTGELAELNGGKAGHYRQRAKHRIPEPQHSQHLMWLDRFSVEDISLLIGMHVFHGRLRLTKANSLSANRRS